MKILPNGIAVLKDDTHISKWVEESGRLDHDQNTLPRILPLIRPGDVVIDGGAFIGDHTIAYLQAVGENGIVHAFEPNELAYACLELNCRTFKRLATYRYGLTDTPGWDWVQPNDNAGASQMAGQNPSAIRKSPYGCQMVRIDQMQLNQLNFLKLDVEGFELKALRGARETLIRCRPIVFVELNDETLAIQGASKGDILAFMTELGYKGKLLFDDHTIEMPMTDALFFP